jgi:hypothetical protein
LEQQSKELAGPGAVDCGRIVATGGSEFGDGEFSDERPARRIFFTKF